MQEVASADYVHRIVTKYGSVGSERLAELLASLRRIYTYLAPETLTEGLTVFAPLSASTPLPAGGVTIRLEHLATEVTGPTTLWDAGTGELTIWHRGLDSQQLSVDAVVYSFDGADHFVLGDELVDVPVTPGFSSLFAMPTFTELEAALIHYEKTHARRLRCKVLSGCWDDDSRLVLRNRPESVMRDSLEQFLLATLRDCLIELRPEQNVDASHPVDIKITWSLTNRLALIEVKWVGDSINAKGTGFTSYRGARANSGAKQLADYLEMNKTSAPLHTTRGYLVVFDGRRRRLSFNHREISAPDAHHYADKEIAYEPAYHLTRDDFAPPSRFFMEPNVSLS